MYRHHHPLSALMIDIDHFKQYNDELGHLQGDECLVTIAGIIESVCRRAGDFATRFGGEEFTIVLPEASRAQARQVGELLLARVADAALPHPKHGIVSVSIGGYTAMGGELLDSDKILEAADKALYESKENGRDRLTLA